MDRTHAAPLSAVDTVVVDEDGVTAEKRIVATDPYLSGHYPGFTIYPGVFTIESVHQAVRAMAGDTEIERIVSLRLNAPLLPGDTLRIRADRVSQQDGVLRVKAVCHRADGVVAAKMTLDLRGEGW